MEAQQPTVSFAAALGSRPCSAAATSSR